MYRGEGASELSWDQWYARHMSELIPTSVREGVDVMQPTNEAIARVCERQQEEFKQRSVVVMMRGSMATLTLPLLAHVLVVMHHVMEVRMGEHT